MTTIPSDVYQGAGGLSEEEKTDLVPATAGEVAKYFNAVPALNKRLRGHDVSRRSTPGDPTNEDTRVLMAFVKALYNALFNGEWADPNTLELAPNGKIRVKDVYVDGDRYPGVNNGNAFYLVDNIPAIIGSMIKDGGGLATDENGELYVDFSLLDPAVLQAIVYAMVQQGGGLSVDQNGQLYVDFDSMPTDKFEALLASLKMQAPLTANKTLYVDNVLGSDTISVDGVTRPVSITDNHGTSTTPFASIGACVEYATSKYAVGRYTLTIRVITNAGVPYREYVELPMFSRTSGKMVLMADDVSSPPKLTNRPASGSVQTTQTRLLRCTGGAWELRYFDIDAAYSDAGDSNLHLPGALGVSDGGSLTVFGCSIAAEFLGAAPSATHSLRLISVSGGGTLSFDVVAQLHNSLSCITGNATDSQFIRVDNAMVRLLSRNTSSIPETSAGEYTITCTGGGQDNVFLFAQNYGQLTIVGGGNKYQNFSGPNVVGKCYTLTTGSGVYAPAGGFPGDSDPAGTVQDSTYCWYREQGAEMAPTKLDICNMALGFIGTRTIQGSELMSSPPNSPEAVQCNLYWDRARRAVLTDFVCEFSVRRSSLSSSSAASSLSANWAGKYAYPTKALKILSVHSGADDERQPFEVDYVSDTQCVILTDATSPQCVYVVDVEDLTQWNEVFVNAMALKLAILISTALLKNNPEKIKELASLYQAAMPRGMWGEGGWAVNEVNTKLGVMNMALGLAGVRMVTSVTENVPEAVQCNLYWDRARRSVLRDFPYRFAVRRSALTPVVSFPTVYDGEWTNCYTAPADMLKVLSIGTATDKQTRQAFSVEHLASGPVIFCNVANAQCTYTADVTDPSKWDEKFTAAMAAKLALYICGPLLAGEKDQGLNKAKELGELYKASIPQDQNWEEGGWASSGDSERLNISNMALGYVGASMISSLTENVPEAVQCNLHWDRARRKVLRDYPYRFAIRRDVLTTDTMPEAYDGDWEKAYAWPTDCLRVLSVHDPEDREARQPFAIEYTVGGPLILCNVTDAEATYIADVEDTALWDEKFIDAMARRLAIEIATALLSGEDLTGATYSNRITKGKLEILSQLYQMALPGPPMVEENWAVEQNSTRLNICNMALGYVEARTISSVTENIPEAIQCSLHWDNARRTALRDFPYRFAQQRFQLVPVAMPDMYKRQSIPAAGSFWFYVYGDSIVRAGGGGNQWQYCYKMPDCLKIVRVHDGRDRIHRIPFAIELVDGKPHIFTNVPNAQATCTIDVEDVEQWDELFVQAMARKLAILIYPALKKELPRYEQPRRA